MFHNICRKCQNIDKMDTGYRSLKNFELKKTRNRPEKANGLNLKDKPK